MVYGERIYEAEYIGCRGVRGCGRCIGGAMGCGAGCGAWGGIKACMHVEHKTKISEDSNN